MVSNRLRLIREKMGLSQEKFGTLMNVNQRTQRNYESGVSYPDTLYLELLSKHGGDIMFLLTGSPMTIDSLNNDEKELLQNYKMSSSVEKQAILAVSKAFTNKNDSSDDQEPDSEDKGLSRASKKTISKKAIKNSSSINMVGKTIMYRTYFYSITSMQAILLAMIVMVAINFIMMTGNNFNAPEYNWLAITAYIVMNVGLVAVLSKFIINKFSLFCEKDQKLES